MKKLIALIAAVTLTLPMFIIATPAGSNWLLRKVIAFYPEKISVKTINGDLFHGLQVTGIKISDKSLSADIKQLTINWQPLALLYGKIQLDNLLLSDAVIQLKSNQQKQSRSNSQFSLLNAIVVKRFNINNAAVFTSAGRFTINGYYQGKIQAKVSYQSKDNEQSVNVDVKGDASKASLSGEIAAFQQKQPFTGTLFLTKKMLQLELNTLTLPELHQQLSDNQLKFVLKSKVVNFNWQAKNKEGNINASGHISLNPKQASHIKLSTDEVTLVNTAQYHAKGSLKLNAEIAYPNIDISGQVLLNKAKLAPFDFSHSSELPKETNLVSREPDKALKSSWQIRPNIQLNLGPEVYIDVEGLSGRLSGELSLYEKNTKNYAKGKIVLHQGKIQRDGLALTVDEASASYQDDLISNPLVELTASKQVTTSQSLSSVQRNIFSSIDNNMLSDREKTQLAAARERITIRKIRVGIKARGRLETLKLTPFSDPSGLSQEDILAYLVTGRSLQHLTSKDSNQLANLAALAPLLGADSNKLTSTINDKLGIDISLANRMSLNESTHQLTSTPTLYLSKALSPKLYLSYGFGLFQSSNIFKLNYLLTKKISIQTQTSDKASGIDIIFHSST